MPGKRVDVIMLWFIVGFSSILMMSWWPKSKLIKQIVPYRYTTLAPLALTSCPAKHVVYMNTASGQLYFKARQQWPRISICATHLQLNLETCTLERENIMEIIHLSLRTSLVFCLLAHPVAFPYGFSKGVAAWVGASNLVRPTCPTWSHFGE